MHPMKSIFLAMMIVIAYSESEGSGQESPKTSNSLGQSTSGEKVSTPKMASFSVTKFLEWRVQSDALP